MKQSKMTLKSFFKVFILPVFIIMTLIPLFNGCASVQTKEMGLKTGQEKLSYQEGSLCLLSIKTDNKYKPEWPPEVWAIELIDQATDKKVNIAVQSKSFGSLLKKGLNDTFTYDKGTSSWEGLISFKLPPGQYCLTAIRGGCTRGIGIGAAMASFGFPFDTPFRVYDKECVYLGRIEMINRERTSEDEIPSGDSTITRLPQQHSGFGTGTFDVEIFDNLDEDINKFREEYPVIGDIIITKRILPPWRKATHPNP
jgi:hypothetical protein